MNAEPFGYYIELDDGTSLFRKAGDPFPPSPQSYKVLPLYAMNELGRSVEEIVRSLAKGGYVNLARSERDRLEAEAKVHEALGIALRYGGIGGDHHKTWVIDQMVRALTGPYYERFVKDAKAGIDGVDTFEWDEGIAP